MTIQLLTQYGPYSPHVPVTLAPSEETRLVGLGLARVYTSTTDDQSPLAVTYDPDTGAQTAGSYSVSGAGNAATIALLGDSYFANANGYLSSVLWAIGSQSPFASLNMLLGNPWDLVYDGSVGGTNTNQWIANQLQGVANSGAGYAFVGFPTNDPDGIQDYATTIANLTTIYAALKARGMKIITYSGGNKASWTGAQRGIALRIGAWITQQANANGWPLMDLFSATYDPATAKGSTSLYQSESGIYTHPNTAGALAAAARNLNNFASIPARAVNSVNGPSQGFYNTQLNGNTSGYPDGWVADTAVGGTAMSASKVNRVDGLGQFVRLTGTSVAGGDRMGMTTANISLTAAWSTGAKALGARAKGSYGDHWVCTTAGTSSGTEPAAMAAASSLGDTVTDSGGVVWTRYTTLVPGVSRVSVAVEFDITGVSGGDLGVTPYVALTWGGPNTPGALRGNNPPSSDIAGQWGFSRSRRPVLFTPPQTIVTTGGTGFQLQIQQRWTAAGVTSNLDIYGVSVRID